MHVCLSHLEGQTFGVRRTHRHLVEEAAVDAGNRNRPAFAASKDRFTQRVRSVGGHSREFHPLVVDVIDAHAVRFQTDGIDAGIRAAPARPQMQFFERIDFGIVNRLRARFLRQLESLGNVIDGDHTLRPQQERRLDREQSDRAAAPDGNRVAFLNVAVFRRFVTGRKDVGQEQNLLVGQPFGDFVWPHIGVRDTRILRLSARVAAEQVRISEQA